MISPGTYLVTGSKHYHVQCMNSLSREERWAVFQLVRELGKRGEIDDLTVHHFNDWMQFTEQHSYFMQQTPDQSENDEYE